MTTKTMKTLAPKVALFSKLWGVPTNFIDYVESKSAWIFPDGVGQHDDSGKAVASFAFFNKKDFDSELFTSYSDAINKAAAMYSVEYFGLSGSVDTGSIEIKRYEDGGYYGSHQHNPDDPEMSHKVKIVTYLNDNYGGGEILFDDFDISLKAAKGDVLIFPSDYYISVSPSFGSYKYVTLDAVKIRLLNTAGDCL